MENEQIVRQNQHPQVQQKTNKEKNNWILPFFAIQITFSIFLLGLAIAGYLAPKTDRYEAINQSLASVRIIMAAVNLLFSLILGLLGVRKHIPRISIVILISIVLEIGTILLSYLTLIKYQ